MSPVEKKWWDAVSRPTNTPAHDSMHIGVTFLVKVGAPLTFLKKRGPITPKGQSGDGVLGQGAASPLPTISYSGLGSAAEPRSLNVFFGIFKDSGWPLLRLSPHS